MCKAILECVNCGNKEEVDTNITIKELKEKGKINSKCKNYIVTFNDGSILFMHVS